MTSVCDQLFRTKPYFSFLEGEYKSDQMIFGSTEVSYLMLQLQSILTACSIFLKFLLAEK